MRRLAALVLLMACDAYRVLLVFPMPSKSNANLGEGYVRHLLNAGHQVTYITAVLIKNRHNNLRQIDVSSNFDLIVTTEVFDLTRIMNKEIPNMNVEQLLHFSHVFSNASVLNENVQKLLHDPKEAFDIVVVQWSFTEVYCGLASQKHAALYELAFSSAAAARGHTLPPYHEARYNGSLMFGNSHASIGSALSLPPNYIPIAGFHIHENVQPLPEDLQSIMDNAKDGVIFFSMGSILSSKTLSNELKSQLLEMFSNFKQTIIWKLEESPDNLPKNVHLVDYAPQQSILAHPNCVLFISHGGMLSSTEALHFSVPIIGIPVFADQFLNIDRAVRKGYAKMVHLAQDLPLKLKEAIEDVLVNPRYRVAELSIAYHDRVTSPGSELVYWLEHVVRTRGAPHLRSPALLLPWYQKMYLDLIALILILIIISYRVLKWSISLRKLDVNKKIN